MRPKYHCKRCNANHYVDSQIGTLHATMEYSKPVQTQQSKRVFMCPHCQNQTITVSKDKKAMTGTCTCGKCGLKGTVKITSISEPVDIYGDFLDQLNETTSETLTIGAQKLSAKPKTISETFKEPGFLTLLDDQEVMVDTAQNKLVELNEQKAKLIRRREQLLKQLIPEGVDAKQIWTKKFNIVSKKIAKIDKEIGNTNQDVLTAEESYVDQFKHQWKAEKEYQQKHPQLLTLKELELEQKRINEEIKLAEKKKEEK